MATLSILENNESMIIENNYSMIIDNNDIIEPSLKNCTEIFAFICFTYFLRKKKKKKKTALPLCLSIISVRLLWFKKKKIYILEHGDIHTLHIET